MVNLCPLKVTESACATDAHAQFLGWTSGHESCLAGGYGFTEGEMGEQVGD
ncbi:MAG: hypothetical protein P8L40_09420 [Planktomarina sp.]|nr:hypothetical protein [Planktomarina sp.]